MSGFVATILLGAGALALVPAVYLLTLSIAATRYRPRAAPRAHRTRVIILVPAHDEEGIVGRCVRSLAAQAYPRTLYEIVVVADNCTDATAAEAAAAGARVLVRDDPAAPGKGHALRWAIDRVLADDGGANAVAVVDADAVADRAFLAVATAELERGARAVQAEDRLHEDGTPVTALRAAAFRLVDSVRPAGRAVLGLPCQLCGSGMALRRDALAAVPWTAFTSAEDAEYTLELRRA